jgi:N-acetylglucosamine-6-phosphate deacetylase
MDRAVANLVDWTTATFEEATAAASLNPARLIGAVDRGQSSKGARQDVYRTLEE